MAFPYSYIRKFEIYNNSLNLKYLYEKLDAISQKFKFSDINIHDNFIEITTKNSLIYFLYQIKIEIDEDNNLLIFDIQIINLMKISLLIMIAIPFISNFSLKKFFIFSVIVIGIFYLVNFLYINSFINNLSKYLIEGTEIDKVTEEEISEIQKEWIENPNKCSACGAFIHDYYVNCFDCGIKLERKATKSPFNVTKYADYDINYSLKNNK